MSLSIGFDTGLKSLLTAQAALQTIGNNIANANTPGFARQQVILGEAAPVTIAGLSFGTGVQVSEVRRMVDEAVEARLQSHRAVLSRLRVERAGMRQLETMVSGAGGTGLSSLLGKVFSSLSTLATHPEDKVGRTDVLANANTLAGTLRELQSQLRGFRRDAMIDVELRLAEANSISTQIAELNSQISTLKAKGVQAHGLADRRQALLNDLAQILDVTTIADANGSLRVLAAGRTIVSGKSHFDLELKQDSKGAPEIRVKGSSGALAAGQGAVAGLLKLGESTTPVIQKQLDSFAKSMALAFNRIHSTGMPQDGGFQSLQAFNTPEQGAAAAALPFSAAGFPFDVVQGKLFVNVQNSATGELSKFAVDVSPSDSLQQFANKIEALPHLSASIDSAGHLRITAASGYRFDFSPRIDPNPGATGGFGSTYAGVSSTGSEPYAVTDGSSLSVAVDGGSPQMITFSSGQFADISKATAEEIAAAINSQVTGATARVDHGRVVIASNTEGILSSIQIADGSGAPNAVLGFSTTLDTGTKVGASPTLSGSYTGAANDQWTFKADSDGTIGVTEGLTVGVYDAAGNRIATLEVGEGYSAGTKLLIKDGISVSFDAGEISATAGDAFDADVLAQSDTSDVLSALGMNAFFVGSSATDIEVRPDLLADPTLLAGSLSGAAGDGANLTRLLALQDLEMSEIGGSTLSESLTEMVSNLGFDGRRAGDLEKAQESLVADLSRQREEVSGVSMEEEMANLVRFQQAFDAAGRYIRVVQDATASLLDLIR
ncbi:MAG: flagellar hook-associated protein FlgK [Planctomycetes bacterium]|nr:flagellar hook-associated protein FlgK [Planctomycetota bacterium]